MFDRPTRQVAEIALERDDRPKGNCRVFAVRTTERNSGQQVQLWAELHHSVHVYVPNHHDRDVDELARAPMPTAPGSNRSSRS